MKIPRENIEELTYFFNQFYWLLYIPFGLYTSFLTYDVANKQMEVAKMDKVLRKYVEAGCRETFEGYENLSYLPQASKNEKAFWDSKMELSGNIKDLDVDSDDWNKRMENLIMRRDFLFQAFDCESAKVEKVLYKRELEKWLLNSERYPGCRPLAKYYLMKSTVEAMWRESFWSGSGLSCNYFNPVVHKYDGSLFVYPDKAQSYYGKGVDLKVDGQSLKKNTYTFLPEEKGMHHLNIEYTFWGSAGKQTMKVVKGLLVE